MRSTVDCVAFSLSTGNKRSPTELILISTSDKTKSVYHIR